MPESLTPFEEQLTELVLAVNRADGPQVGRSLNRLVLEHTEEFARFADLAENTYAQVEAQVVAFEAQEGGQL